MALFAGCSKKNQNQALASLDHIVAVDAQLPLRLGEVDLAEDGEALNDGINTRINKSVEDYYKNECLGDSLHSYKETYVGTLQIQQKPYTLFLVLVKHYPAERLSVKVLFYDNAKKEFIDGEYDLKLYALYDYRNGQLVPSRWKSQLKIDSPEIEVVDYDKNGTDDLKFVRLMHSGGYNALITTIVSLANHKIEILNDEEKPVR